MKHAQQAELCCQLAVFLSEEAAILRCLYDAGLVIRADHSNLQHLVSEGDITRYLRTECSEWLINLVLVDWPSSVEISHASWSSNVINLSAVVSLFGREHNI